MFHCFLPCCCGYLSESICRTRARRDSRSRPLYTGSMAKARVQTRHDSNRRMIDRTRSKLVSLVSLPTALRFFKSLLANERELGPEIFFRDLAIVELFGKIQPTRSVT